ncbi:cytidine deaminase-like fold-containing protein [Salmonella enterica subsp. enterica]
MNGEIFTGSNPTERTPRGGGKTLPGLGYPNNDRYSMHAEIDAMMKAHDKGMRGGKGVLTVEGLPVCDFCKRSLKNMAQHLGLEDFTVHEKSTGLTYRFKGNDLHPVRKGGKGFKGCGIK